MSTPQTQLSIRSATVADIPEITAIFTVEVLHGTASWSYEPPSEEEMREKLVSLQHQGYPYLVAQIGDRVAGYSYASAYRPRVGYRFLVENSIYVATDFRGQGVARLLLQTLIEQCTERGYRQMIAVIGDSNNKPSIALHRSLGFEQVGLLPNIGYKFDRWLDSVLMQRALGTMALS